MYANICIQIRINNILLLEYLCVWVFPSMFEMLRRESYL